jgi:hypothetical protein
MHPRKLQALPILFLSELYLCYYQTFAYGFHYTIFTAVLFFVHHGTLVDGSVGTPQYPVTCL